MFIVVYTQTPSKLSKENTEIKNTSHRLFNLILLRQYHTPGADTNHFNKGCSKKKK